MSGWLVATQVPCGVRKKPVPNERQVYNLEDGGVPVQYNCTNCVDLIAQLEALAARFEYVIVASYPDKPHRITLTAWGRIQTFDAYDEAQFTAFIAAYAGLDHHPRGF